LGNKVPHTPLHCLRATPVLRVHPPPPLLPPRADKFNRREPVQGRVLNDCPGGYAVGLAGHVALLPYSQATTATVQRVGQQQEFYITRMDRGAAGGPERGGRIVVEDAQRRRAAWRTGRGA
jgi:hypothetical protein